MKYAKVFDSIWEGSMRGRADPLFVFVNLLTHSDENGIVDRHWKAIIDETGLPEQRVRDALEYLESPDPDSKTPIEEGRRIVRLDPNRTWGWRIVNHAKYRELCTKSQNAERQRRFRESGGGDPDRWPAIRARILVLDGATCGYCGKDADQVDHIIPKSRGGDESDFNLTACCKSCNSVKNNRTPKEAGMTLVNHRVTHPVTLCHNPPVGVGVGGVVSSEGGCKGGYTLEDCQTAAEGIGLAPQDVEDFLIHYAAVDFVDGAGRKITSLKHALAKWKKNQVEHQQRGNHGRQAEMGNEAKGAADRRRRADRECPEPDRPVPML